MSRRGYDIEKLVKIGKIYKDSDMSIREMAEEYDVNRNAVSKGKQLYEAQLLYQENMEKKYEDMVQKIAEDYGDEIRELRERLERVRENMADTETDTNSVEFQDYVENMGWGEVFFASVVTFGIFVLGGNLLTKKKDGDEDNEQ